MKEVKKELLKQVPNSQSDQIILPNRDLRLTGNLEGLGKMSVIQSVRVESNPSQQSPTKLSGGSHKHGEESMKMESLNS